MQGAINKIRGVVYLKAVSALCNGFNTVVAIRLGRPHSVGTRDIYGLGLNSCRPMRDAHPQHSYSGGVST